MRLRARAAAGLRWLRFALVALVAVYAVGRAVVEVVTVNPRRPETYAQDWGGPQYLGVIAVHAGPGLLVLALTLLWARRRRHHSAE